MRTSLIIPVLILVGRLALTSLRGDEASHVAEFSDRSQPRWRFEAQPGSQLRIAGTSNLQDWSLDGRIISGFVEFGAGFGLNDALKPGPIEARAECSVPIRTLRSSSGAFTEAVWSETFDRKKHPRILYRLHKLVLKEPVGGRTPVPLDAQGELVVAGVTNVVSMGVFVEEPAKGKLKITGSTTLKMTAFGIRPPTPSIAAGMVRMGDQVRISFEWLVGRNDR